MPMFAANDDPRIARIRRSSSLFYWSIKHSKIIYISANSVTAERKCDLCIPKYRPGTSKECEFKFTTLNSFKRHVQSCEFKFKRPLMWATKKEIPTTGLKREREIGDLRTMQNIDIMRINFRTKSLVMRPREMMKYFRTNGCHCKDELGKKCSVQLGATFLSMFYHLAHLERERQEYMVFKATAAELSEYEALENKQPNQNSPECSTSKPASDQSPSSSTPSPSNLSPPSFRPADGSIPADTVASSRHRSWPADSFASTSSGISFGTSSGRSPDTSGASSGKSLPTNSWNQMSNASATKFRLPNSLATSGPAFGSSTVFPAFPRSMMTSFNRTDGPVNVSNLRLTPPHRTRMLRRMYYGKKPVPALDDDGAGK